LAVVREDSLEVLERDWLDPARRALDRGRFDCVELYLDGRRVTARRSLLKRWFARPHSLAPTSRGAHG